MCIRDSIKVTQCHVVQTIHELEASEQLLTPHLGGAIECLVIVWIVGFRSGKMLCEPIDRCTRTINYFFDFMLYCKLRDFKSGFKHYIKSIAGICRACINTQGSHVKNIVAAFNA